MASVSIMRRIGSRGGNASCVGHLQNVIDRRSSQRKQPTKAKHMDVKVRFINDTDMEFEAIADDVGDGQSYHVVIPPRSILTVLAPSGNRYFYYGHIGDGYTWQLTFNPIAPGDGYVVVATKDNDGNSIVRDFKFPQPAQEAC